MLTDPEIVEEMSKAPKPKPGPPPLFGWTKEIGMLANINDQLIASRVQPGQKQKPRFMPRPVIPGWELRSKRMDSRLLGNIATAQDRFKKNAARGT